MQTMNQNLMQKVVNSHNYFVDQFSTIKVYRVVHIMSPSSFFVEPLIPPSSKFFNWKEKMQNFYNVPANREANKLKTELIKLDRLYAFFYQSSNEWRRVRAVAKGLETGIVKIKSIDNGHLLDAVEDDLFELHPHFISWPWMACKVKLHGVVPLDGQNWSTESINQFKDLVRNKVFFAICPTELLVLVHGDIIPLVLYEKSAERFEHTLQQELVFMGAAKFGKTENID